MFGVTTMKTKSKFDFFIYFFYYFLIFLQMGLGMPPMDDDDDDAGLLAELAALQGNPQPAQKKGKPKKGILKRSF